MNKVEFANWVDEMYEKFCCDNNVQATFFDEQITTAIVYHFKKRKIGVARCHPDDTFNREVGIAIAYARCKGFKVPKISTYKKLSEMKNGDRFYFDGIEHFFVLCTESEAYTACPQLAVLDRAHLVGDADTHGTVGYKSIYGHREKVVGKCRRGLVGRIELKSFDALS